MNQLLQPSNVGGGGGGGGGNLQKRVRRLSSEKKLLAGQIIFSWFHEWIGDGTVEAEDGDDNDNDDDEAEEKASQSENATGRGGDWLQGRDLLPDMETLQETQKMIMDKKAEKTTMTKKPGRRLQRISRERKRLFSSNQLPREQILAKKMWN